MENWFSRAKGIKQQMKKYKVFVFIGEAGSGKDLIVSHLALTFPEIFHKMISYTTRPKRSNEIDGEAYHFVTIDKFKQLDMLEQNCFNYWYYGTPVDCLVEDKINIGVLNPSGAIALSQREDLDVTIFRLKVRPQTRLIRQLSREVEPNIEEIFRRYHTDEKDFEKLYFNYISFDNNDYAELQKIIEAVRKIALDKMG